MLRENCITFAERIAVLGKVFEKGTAERLTPQRSNEGRPMCRRVAWMLEEGVVWWTGDETKMMGCKVRMGRGKEESKRVKPSEVL